MSVFRVHKTDNYTTMSNHHLRNGNLTLKAKGLMSVMLSLPEDWDYSAKGLATLSFDGEDAVKSALKELEEHHYLKRTPIREKGVIRDWQYDIYENPESLENTESQPQGEKPLVAEPLVEKQSQINTKEINTKRINNNFTNVKLEQPSVTQPKRRIKIVDTSNTHVNENSVNNTVNQEKPKKKNLYEKCLDSIDEFTEDTEIKELLITYFKVRREMKDYPLYFNQWRGYINELKRLVNMGQEAREVIQQSINRGYKGFYEVKKYNNYKNNGIQDQSVFSEFGKVKSERRENEVVLNVSF